MVRSAAFRRRALILLKTCSIGYLAFESSADVRGRQSARSCSLACKLFKGDIMSFEKSPDCGAAAWELLAHRNQGQEPFGVLLQRRRASSTRLCAGASSFAPALQPSHHRTDAELEDFRCFPPRRPGFDCFDHTLPQVSRIRLGIDSPSQIPLEPAIFIGLFLMPHELPCRLLRSWKSLPSSTRRSEWRRPRGLSTSRR